MLGRKKKAEKKKSVVVEPEPEVISEEPEDDPIIDELEEEDHTPYMPSPKVAAVQEKSIEELELELADAKAKKEAEEKAKEVQEVPPVQQVPVVVSKEQMWNMIYERQNQQEQWLRQIVDYLKANEK